MVEVRRRRAAQKVRERDAPKVVAPAVAATVPRNRRRTRPGAPQGRQRQDIEPSDQIAGRPRGYQQGAEATHGVQRDETQVVGPRGQPPPTARRNTLIAPTARKLTTIAEAIRFAILRLRTCHDPAARDREHRIAANAARQYTKVSALQTAATPTVRTISASRSDDPTSIALEVPARITIQGNPKRAAPCWDSDGRAGPARFATRPPPARGPRPVVSVHARRRTA